MSPRAPRSETAAGSQPDSTPMTAITSTGSRPGRLGLAADDGGEPGRLFDVQ